MGTTLKTLRQLIGLELGECITGRVDSATAYTLTDADLIDPDESSTLYDRAWLKLYTSAGLDSAVRRLRAANEETGVKGYDPDSGTLRWTRALDSVPEAGDEYELHTLMAPDDLDRCIDNGLARCYYLDDISIPVVSDRREYSLSAYTYLTDITQIIDVFWYYGDTSQERQLIPLEWFNVQADSNALTLHIRPLTYSTATATLLLRVVRPYGTGIWTEAGTACPLDWAKAAALVECYTWLQNHAPAQDAKRYEAAQLKAAANFAALCYKYQPRPSRRIQLDDTPRLSDNMSTGGV